jgi:hypothetical protein
MALRHPGPLSGYIPYLPKSLLYGVRSTVAPQRHFEENNNQQRAKPRNKMKYGIRSRHHECLILVVNNKEEQFQQEPND